MTQADTDIWGQFNDKLIAFLKSRGVDENDALDIIQEVFLKYDSHKEHIRNVSGWLYRVTQNEMSNFYRKQKSDELKTELVTPELDKEKFISCLGPFIDSLENREQVLLGKQLKGLALKKIAQELDLPYATIKSQALRAREKLRKKFMACCQVNSIAKLQEICSDC